MRYSIIFFLFIIFISPFALAAPIDSVKVTVIDEKETPVSDVRVFLEGNPSFVTNKSGFFSFKPSQKLVLPFDISIERKGYEMEEFTYFENDNEIEIRVKKVNTGPRDFSIRMTSPNKTPIASVHIIYNGKNYATDKEGNVKIFENKFVENLLTVQGFKVDIVKASSDNKLFTIELSPSLKETALEQKKVSDPVVSKQVDSVKALPADVISQKELEEQVFKQYQQEFDNLSVDIIAERSRLIESNKIIRGEIERLTLKFKNEKNLSPEKRQQLKNNIDELEKNLIENAIAYNKAEEKTLGMIQNLKMLVMQKDSINAITVKKLHAEEKKRISVEKKAKRTLIIFTIITISLVFLGIVFYNIARKMRSQRTALLKSNEELRKLKEEFELGIKELN